MFAQNKEIENCLVQCPIQHKTVKTMQLSLTLKPLKTACLLLLHLRGYLDFLHSPPQKKIVNK